MNTYKVILTVECSYECEMNAESVEALREYIKSNPAQVTVVDECQLYPESITIEDIYEA